MSDQILSQEEINALLTSLAEEEAVSKAAAEAAAFGSETGQKSIQRYDFMRPDKFSKDQLRTLQMMHDSFSRSLQTSLAGMMRMPVQAEVLSVAEIMYEEFIDQLSNPSILSVVKLEPIGGNIVLEINPNLGFVMLDRLLGGPGRPIGRPRSLTDIEQTLMQRVIERLLEGLEAAWRPVVAIEPTFKRIEVNPQFVQVVPPNDMAVIVSLRVRLKEESGRINLCLPYTSLEPVASKLKAQVWFASAQPGESREDVGEIRERLETMSLRLAVELGEADVSVGDLLELQVGDVVQLDTRTDQPLVLRIGNKKKFLGLPGRMGSRLAVQVVDVIREDD